MGFITTEKMTIIEPQE